MLALSPAIGQAAGRIVDRPHTGSRTEVEHLVCHFVHRGVVGSISAADNEGTFVDDVQAGRGEVNTAVWYSGSSVALTVLPPPGSEYRFVVFSLRATAFWR